MPIPNINHYGGLWKVPYRKFITGLVCSKHEISKEERSNKLEEEANSIALITLYLEQLTLAENCKVLQVATTFLRNTRIFYTTSFAKRKKAVWLRETTIKPQWVFFKILFL